LSAQTAVNQTTYVFAEQSVASELNNCLWFRLGSSLLTLMPAPTNSHQGYLVSLAYDEYHKLTRTWSPCSCTLLECLAALPNLRANL